MNTRKLSGFILLFSLIGITILSACSQIGAIADVAQITTPTSAQASSVDYEELSTRVTALEKRVSLLEQLLIEKSVQPTPTLTPTITPTPTPTPNLEDEYGKELRNIQTAVMAMLADSNAGVLDSDFATTNDMDDITADSGTLRLSKYLTGLNADGTLRSGCSYAFNSMGIVTQTKP